MNKHNQKPTGMFNKQDVTVHLTFIKILKDYDKLNFDFTFQKSFSKYYKVVLLRFKTLYNNLKMASGM